MIRIIASSTSFATGSSSGRPNKFKSWVGRNKQPADEIVQRIGDEDDKRQGFPHFGFHPVAVMPAEKLFERQKYKEPGGDPERNRDVISHLVDGSPNHVKERTANQRTCCKDHKRQ